MVAQSVGRAVLLRRYSLRAMTCASATAVAAVTVLSPSRPSSAVATSDVTVTAKKNPTEECDCAPLWKCITEAGQCSQLELQLKECMARSEPVVPR